MAAPPLGERLAELRAIVESNTRRIDNLERKFDSINGKLTALLTVVMVATLAVIGNLAYALLTSGVHP